MKHHSPQKKRNKAYRPKHVQVPVMPDLQREFIFAAHGALAALRLAPNDDAFDQLAAIFNVVYTTMKSLGRASVILESGMRALQDVALRQARTKALSITRFELPPIENAVAEIETLPPQLDVVRLHVAAVKSRIVQRVSAALAPLESA